MNQKLKNYYQQHYSGILSFCLPIIIMTIYFMFRHVYPFGKSTLLTIDLGQQYIDFYAYYQHTLLHSPTSLFYSFAKALGGNMMGEWAYYLLSPFNLILLLFPKNSIVAGITVLTLLKYGLAGWSLNYFLQKQTQLKAIFIPIFTLSYALMGWMIANQLNLLWSDALIFFPLIMHGFYRLFQTGSRKVYVGWLAVMMIANYYMAYMICLFLIVFFIWYSVINYHNFKSWLKSARKFISSSLLAAGLAAIILLPTIYSLSVSKGQYVQRDLDLSLAYMPWEMGAKFFLGAFNFSQIPEGLPNLFVGGFVFFNFLLYFVCTNISRKERLTSLIVTLFFGVSLFWQPLNLLWHGLQFPVWYPFRFSYLISFWLIFLAVRHWQFSPNYIKFIKIIILELILLSYATYLWFDLQNFTYLSKTKIITTVTLATITLVILSQKNLKTSRLIPIVLLCTSGLYLTVNMVFSLNSLSYLTYNKYAQPSSILRSDIKRIKKHDTGFYRVGQTYFRTKNDGVAHDFNSGSYFSSALEKQIPDFYGQIGQPDGDNYAIYANGTLLSDALLDYKYFLNPKDNSEIPRNYNDFKNPVTLTNRKSDLKEYKLISNQRLTRIYENPNVTSIAYLASPSLKKLSPLYDLPTIYQTRWLNDVAAQMPNTRYFHPCNFQEVVFQNIKPTNRLTGAHLKKIKPKKAAKVIFKFTPKTNDPYYLTLGPDCTSENVDIYIGNQSLKYSRTFRHTIILNIADHAKGQEIIISTSLKKKKLTLDHFVLYRLDRQAVKNSLAEVKDHTLKITEHQPTKISGEITVPKDIKKILTTTIPYDAGWHVQIDHKAVKTFKVQDTFLACDIKPGKHQIQFSYRPPYLILGAIISGISLVIASYLYYRQLKH
ncbi:YfhO family protein [Ligilactobacillus ceti]|uniref:Integral membrane protein n=1 Tax=Ligilactobacillus ceti DSM 22408 TaxID=1122146 RepID=A0A0R2KLF4_9LACO|nr:YfhO family protein [Ligilactobacillus ceti]KRN88566.1 hypothetical protein IV53_GL000531 [Ligilactobacillus ceti DSM 22408]